MHRWADGVSGAASGSERSSSHVLLSAASQARICTAKNPTLSRVVGRGIAATGVDDQAARRWPQPVARICRCRSQLVRGIKAARPAELMNPARPDSGLVGLSRASRASIEALILKHRVTTWNAPPPSPSISCPKCGASTPAMAGSTFFSVVDYYRCDSCVFVWSVPRRIPPSSQY